MRLESWGLAARSKDKRPGPSEVPQSVTKVCHNLLYLSKRWRYRKGFGHVSRNLSILSSMDIKYDSSLGTSTTSTTDVAPPPLKVPALMYS